MLNAKAALHHLALPVPHTSPVPSRTGSPPVNGARLHLARLCASARVAAPLWAAPLSALANFYGPFKPQARQAHSRGFAESAARQASSRLPHALDSPRHSTCHAVLTSLSPPAEPHDAEGMHDATVCAGAQPRRRLGQRLFIHSSDEALGTQLWTHAAPRA